LGKDVSVGDKYVCEVEGCTRWFGALFLSLTSGGAARCKKECLVC